MKATTRRRARRAELPSRHEIEAMVELLIEHLDRLDAPADDLEDDAPREPSAWPERGEGKQPFEMTAGTGRELEDEELTAAETGDRMQGSPVDAGAGPDDAEEDDAPEPDDFDDPAWTETWTRAQPAPMLTGDGDEGAEDDDPSGVDSVPWPGATKSFEHFSAERRAARPGERLVVDIRARRSVGR